LGRRNVEIQERKTDGIVFLFLKGRLDASTSPLLEEKMAGLLDAGETRFAIQSAELDYISSSGLRVLLMGAKRLRGTAGKIVLVSPKPHVKDVFDIAGFTAIFPIVASEAEARETL
jgi:anti-anti-sigma factor